MKLEGVCKEVLEGGGGRFRDTLQAAMAEDSLLIFQEEVVAVAGEKALELGLLFGTENITPSEEETDDLCFTHLMLQEFAAAKFICVQSQV